MDPLWHCNKCGAAGDVATALGESNPGAVLCGTCAKVLLIDYLASMPTIWAIFEATRQPTAVGDVLRKRRWLALVVMWWLTGSQVPESISDIDFYFGFRLLYEKIWFTVVYPAAERCPLTRLSEEYCFMEYLRKEGLTEAAELLTDAAGKGCVAKRRRRAPDRYCPLTT